MVSLLDRSGAAGAAAISSPAIDGAMRDWMRAKRDGDAQGLRRAARLLVAAPFGTPVRAAAVGIASVVDHGKDGYGKHVILVHPDGSGTLYGHLGSASVRDGDVLMAGETLGEVGDSGNAAGTPQLHFEAVPANRVLGRPDFGKKHRTLDPIAWLKRPMWHKGQILDEDARESDGTSDQLWYRGSALPPK